LGGRRGNDKKPIKKTGGIVESEQQKAEKVLDPVGKKVRKNAFTIGFRSWQQQQEKSKTSRRLQS